MTVSLEEMLEEEDMLSRWLPGSSLLHRRSFMVASVRTSGTADWARTWPSLFARLTGACDARGLKSALLVWTRGTAGAPVDFPAPGGAAGTLLFSIVVSRLSFWFVLSLVGERVLLFVWSSGALGIGTGADALLEKVAVFLGSPLALVGLPSTPFVVGVAGETGFIAVVGEWRGVDVDRCGDGLSGVEAVQIRWLLLVSSAVGAGY